MPSPLLVTGTPDQQVGLSSLTTGSKNPLMGAGGVTTACHRPLMHSLVRGPM